ncbi:MAG: hypothetical protein MJ145_03435 [Clostridia bacterium]|nr:hypothetical protein [Clostridia bacterium]
MKNFIKNNVIWLIIIGIYLAYALFMIINYQAINAATAPLVIAIIIWAIVKLVRLIIRAFSKTAKQAK